MDSVYERLENVKIVPVVKIEDINKALPLAAALCKGNLPCMEITFRTECAAQAIQLIRREYPDILVGAGTVLSIEQVKNAVDAGAEFIVSPGFDQDTVKYCVDNHIIIIPGCSDPSDIQAAIKFGLTVVKFFPAENAGGLAMIKAMSAPYQGIRFMPTGGINENNLKDYLNYNKIIACGGSWMVKESFIANNQFEKITALCQSAYNSAHGIAENKPEKQTAVEFNAFKQNREYSALALGEILLRLSAPEPERISDSETFEKYAGGAELNVMAGLSQMGLKTGIISKLPKNRIARFIRSEIRAKGTDDRFICDDESSDARIGVYFYEHGYFPRKPSVDYDRKNSSFTKFSVEDIDKETYGNTTLFYTSGITLAVLKDKIDDVIKMIGNFKSTGSIIAFDVNYRANLWDEKEARQNIEKILPMVDVLFVSEESSRRMFGKSGTLNDIMKSYCEEYGVSVVASTKRTSISGNSQSFNSVIYSFKNDLYYGDDSYENIEVVDR
jgi:2-dehydro-3-deoxygluconokinase